MEHNVGRLDAGIRWIVATALFAISLIFNSNPAFALLAAVAALVLLATALIRVCPMYWLLRLNTCPREPAGGHSA